MVSVCVLAYQHGKYISQCLDGILAQKTDFPFEVIVGENDSTDGTREICIDYAKRFPDKIVLKLRSRKDVIYINGAPTGRFNLTASLEESRGKFIAICEGDDYWTDEHKLAKQVKFLDNPEYSGCFHEANRVDEHNNITERNYIPLKRDLVQEDIFRYGNHFPMASILYRKETFRDDELWRKLAGGDRYMLVQLTSHGKIGYLPDNMCAYRRHASGLWSGKSEFEKCRKIYLDFTLYYAEDRYRTKYGRILREKMCDNLAVMAMYHRKNRSFGERMKVFGAYLRLMPWSSYYVKLLVSAVMFPGLYSALRKQKV